MNEKQWLQSLDCDQAAPLNVDVATNVMRDIRQRERESTEPSFAIPALIATLAGGGAVALAFSTFLAVSDPLTSFLDTFKLVLQ